MEGKPELKLVPAEPETGQAQGPVRPGDCPLVRKFRAFADALDNDIDMILSL